MRNREREVRYPDQVAPFRFDKRTREDGSEAMLVHDSVYEQLWYHARSMKKEPLRRSKIYKFCGRSLDYVMMHTVELPEHNWPTSEDVNG